MSLLHSKLKMMAAEDVHQSCIPYHYIRKVLLLESYFLTAVSK